MPVTLRRRAVVGRLVLGALTAVAAATCSGEPNTVVVPPPPPVPPPPVPPPPPPPAIMVDTAPVTFNDTIGTEFGSRTVAITNSGAGTLSGLAVAITYGPGGSNWLTFNLSGTEAPATLTLQPSNTGLAAGLYTATVAVTSGVASNSPQTIPVSLILTAEPPPPPDPPPAEPPPAPIPGVVVAATANIQKCGGALGTASASVVAAINPDFLFVMGDNVYPQAGGSGDVTLADYQNCYEPTWGQFKSITYAAVGGREQDSVGMSAPADAYFGAERVGNPGENWYAFDVGTGTGTWRIIVLNILTGGATAAVKYNNDSPQLNWLLNELDTNDGYRCTLVFWHDPMWISSSTVSATDPNAGYRRQPQRGVWRALYDANVDLVLGGEHIYERFAPMRYDDDTSGSEFEADSVRGIRQISAGLGGDGPTVTPHVTVRHPLSEYRSGGNGVLKLQLGDGIYTWQFMNTSNSNVQDWGTGTCH